jgi:hypothetical protein
LTAFGSSACTLTGNGILASIDTTEIKFDSAIDVEVCPASDLIKIINYGYPYCRQHGWQSPLWIYDPKDYHDFIAKILPIGIRFIKFYRKCFMQLKTFSNLRFK